MIEDKFSELGKYLSCNIGMIQNIEYVKYHTRVININSQNNLYTISFFAWHILWMSFIEKTCYMIYKYDQSGLLDALALSEVQKRIFINACSPYDLSLVNEKLLCGVARYKSILWHANKIKNMTELVDHRDNIAHCSGVIDREVEDIEHDMDLCLRYTKEIADKTKYIIIDNWNKFINDMSSINPEGEREYALVYDAVINYVSNSYLSIFDMEAIFNECKFIDADEEDAVVFSKNLATMHISIIFDSYGVDNENASDEFIKIMRSKYTQRINEIDDEIISHQNNS